MIIRTVVVGQLDTNCYIVASDKTREAVIIDPGDDEEKIIRTIEAEELKPILIINTHAHFDHVGANRELSEKYGIGLASEDSETVRAGELEFKVIRTPGHSEESICLYGHGVLFSGDTMFAGDYGRTDLPGGSERKMTESLDKLLKLPPETKVYPGHGRPTTIFEERKLYAKH